MSRIANDWAWKQEIKPATQKFILIALADRADENHCCFPCYKRIAKDTGLNRKTIESNIAKMVEKGLIIDTEIRKGRTKSVKVWQLNVENKQPQNRSNSNFEATPILPTSDPKIGVQNQSINHPIEPVKETTPLPSARENDEGEKSPPPTPREKGTNPRAKETNPRATGKNPRKVSADTQAVFDFWKTTMGHPKARLDGKRKKNISTALSWEYSVADLCQAIDGCSKTPHNIGQNERGQRYDGLNIILRDADQIDRFMANSVNPPREMSKQDKLEAHNLAVLAEFRAKQANQGGA